MELIESRRAGIMIIPPMDRFVAPLQKWAVDHESK
jgi:hypothetical protein